MEITFSKPATYSGVRVIRVTAPVKWDFPTTVLELEKSDKGWDVKRPRESRIVKNDGTVIDPGRPSKYFAINLPLKIAKQTAADLITSGLWKE